jgi:hypothetical protein
MSPIDVTCAHCNAVVRVFTVAYGVLDEKKWFACPDCGKPLFSWEGARVYDIERVMKHGNSNKET